MTFPKRASIRARQRGGPLGVLDLLRVDRPRDHGGDGDDVIDARTTAATATSLVGCGAGEDRYAGGVDGRVSASCEFAAFRVTPDLAGIGWFPALFDVREPIAPLARGPDGAPTYRVACPSTAQLDAPSGACVGTVALERPPVYGSPTPPEPLGSGAFAIASGQTADVRVTLTGAGRSAVAAGAAVAVHVTGTIPLRRNRETRFDYGWQQQPLGG